MGRNSQEATDDNEKAIKEAIAYYKYINKMCDYSKIVAVMHCAESALEIGIDELDCNPFGPTA